MIIQAIGMIVLTLITYIAAKKLQVKYKHPLLNPALIASIIIILFYLYSV